MRHLRATPTTSTFALAALSVGACAVAVAAASPALASSPGFALLSGERPLVLRLGLLMVAIGFAGALIWATSRVRGGRIDQAADALPAGLSPGVAGLLRGNGALVGDDLLTLLVRLEQRGCVAIAPGPAGRSPAHWQLSMVDPHDADISPAERAVLWQLFPSAATTAVGEALRRTTPDAIRVVRAALAREGHHIGLVRPAWERRVTSTVFFTLLAAAFASPLVPLWATSWQFDILEAATMVVVGVGVAGCLTPMFLTRRGLRVKTLLEEYSHAAGTPFPGPAANPAQDPAWALALSTDPPAGTPLLSARPEFREVWSTAVAHRIR